MATLRQLFCILASLALCANAQTLQVHLAFEVEDDGDKFVTDLSGNGVLAELKNGATISQGQGKIGSAVFITGGTTTENNPHLSLDASVGHFGGLTAGTLSVWLKWVRHPDSSSIGVILGASDHRDADRSLRLYVSDNSDPFNNKVGFMAATDHFGTNTLTNDGFVHDGEWHHVVLTSSSHIGTLYVDGAVDATGAMGWFSDLADMDSLSIGRVFTSNGLGGDHFFSGFLDEVRMWDAALSERDVRDLSLVVSNMRRANATGGYMTVEWDDADSHRGGTAVTHYAIKWQDVDTEWHEELNLASQRHFTLWGLRESSSYAVKVAALTDNGEGPYSSYSQYVATSGKASVAAAPPQPDEVLVTGGAITLNVWAPMDRGGHALAEVQVFIDADHDQETPPEPDHLFEVGIEDVPPHTLADREPFVLFVPSLSPSTSYTFTVATRGAGGCVEQGRISAPLVVTTTAASVPIAPAAPLEDSVTGGCITVTWDVPEDVGGTPITGYRVYGRRKGEQYSFVRLYDGDGDAVTKTAVLYGFDATEYYEFTVAAINSVGEGEPSEPTEILTAAVTRASPPLSVVSSDVSGGRMRLSWSEPQDTGGEAVTYTMLHCNAAETECDEVDAKDATSASVSYLIASTEYHIKVYATNSAGDSPLSSVLAVTTLAMTAPLEPFAPSIVNYTTTSITVFVQRVGDEGGDPSITYELQIGEPSPEDFFVVKDTLYDSIITIQLIDGVALSQGQLYRVRVRATNGVTSTAWSSETNAATRGEQCAQIDGNANTLLCEGYAGDLHIEAVAYTHSNTRTWKIAPSTTPYAGMELRVLAFDLECDHDSLRVEWESSGELLWEGGCTRQPFVLWSERESEPLLVTFTTDESMSRQGFWIQYMRHSALPAERDADCECPTFSEEDCGGNGACAVVDGTCTCVDGYVGEDCSGITLCDDESDYYHAGCDAPSTIILTALHGTDDQGTGHIGDYMDTDPLTGTVGKPVKSLQGGLALATTEGSTGSTLLLFPGVYTGADNCEVLLSGTYPNLRVESIRGAAETIIDCTGFTRVLHLKNDSTVFEGITFKGGASPEDAGLVLVEGEHSSPQFIDCVFTEGTATRYGGAMLVRDGTITMETCLFEDNDADIGGAIYLVDGATVEGGQTTLRTNQATSQAGSLVLQGDVTARGLIVSANTAPRGAGVFITGEGSVFQNSIISSNVASSAGGGVLVENVPVDHPTVFTNVELEANEAQYGTWVGG